MKLTTILQGATPGFSSYLDDDLIASHVARALRQMIPSELDEFAGYCIKEGVTEPTIWRGIAYARAHRKAFP